MAIANVVDSTGTILNRYTLTHADNTTEVITLTFNPSQDYVAGTAFNAASMNPWVALLNGLNDHKLVALTESEYEALATKDANTFYFKYADPVVA